LPLCPFAPLPRPSPQERAVAEALIARLPPREAAAVAAMWAALLTARRDAEAVAARGVRVARDVSRDWQETVSELIDRVVAQDAELAVLRAQQVCVLCLSKAHGARQREVRGLVPRAARFCAACVRRWPSSLPDRVSGPPGQLLRLACRRSMRWERRADCRLALPPGEGGLATTAVWHGRVAGAAADAGRGRGAHCHRRAAAAAAGQAG
jgi:hypothetical protein